MKRIALWFSRLYPRWWRSRYGHEFDALIEDTDVSLRDIFGVVLSVLEIRIKSTTVPHIVDLASRDVPHGYELETAVEYPGEDGGTTLVQGFHREVDLGDSYVNVSHVARGSAPAQTILVFGRKGQVDGDFRTDETEMLVLHADGTVQRTEQTVQTWVKWDAIRDRLRDRYRSGMQAGLTPDEIQRRIQDDGNLSAWS
jgi:hypothetical protein